MHRTLDHLGQACRAFGNQRPGQRFAFAQARHARVQMNLGEAGTRIRLQHQLGTDHGLLGGQMPPRIRPQVIATEDQTLRIETAALSDARHKLAEVSRGHAGIAAFMVDLIAGGFDQHRRRARARFTKRRFDDQGMRGTHRGNAQCATLSVSRCQFLQIMRVHDRCLSITSGRSPYESKTIKINHKFD